MQTLLHLGTPADSEFQYKLANVTAGSQVAWKSKLVTPDTLTDIELSCKKAGVTGIVCSNQEVLEKLLRAQLDFIPPNNRRGITLDDYQGSLLFTPRDRIPVVILNPLENLVTTTWQLPAAKRFISKLTKADKWYKATKFTWELGTPENLPAIHARWKTAARLIAIDIETAVDDPLRRINCVGYCAYFPDTHTTECVVIPFDDISNVYWVRKFNLLPQPKVFQNGLYDNLYFLRWNCPVHNWLWDTQHLFHSMFSEYPKRLDFISAYAIREIRYWKDDGKTGDLADYYRYNARDCWATLNSLLSLVLDCEPYAITNYLIEFPLVFPCLHCELEGWKIDMERLEKVKAEAEQEVLRRETAFTKMIAAPNFNINSPPQVKNLFKVLGVGHLPTTSAPDMLKAQAAHPLNNRVLGELVEIKKKKKLLSTYFVPEKFWHGRCFYKINPAATDTGRLASTESSFWCGLQIQNITRGEAVKQCFVADTGWLLCEPDKAQSEARCVGYLSGETKLIELLEGPHEFHSWNASAFFGIPYEQIYDEAKGKQLNVPLRDLAKRTNHGANYNMGANVMLATMGPKRVAQAKITLKLPTGFSLKQVCEHLLKVYERTYPKVKGLWYDSIIATVMKTGRLVSPLGWTRIFFGTNISRQNKPQLNAAVAHPPQNLSVGIVNKEFYNVWRATVYNSYFDNGVERCAELRGKVRVKAQIHDSIPFQYRETAPDAPRVVQSIMQTKVTVRGADGVSRVLAIPTDMKPGKYRWSELK